MPASLPASRTKHDRPHGRARDDRLKPAVVISGSTSGLAAIRGFGEAGIPVVVLRYDKRDVGHLSRHVREVVPIPYPDKYERRVLDTLADVAARHGGGMVVSACDVAIPLLARRRQAMEAMGLVVAGPPADAALTFLDKASTYALAAAHGVAVPASTVLASAEDLVSYARAGTFPAVLKPSLSHAYYRAFGRKWTRVDDLDHAIAEYEKAAALGLQVSIQEFIPGDELHGANYNSYSVGGIPRVEVTARKIRNSPPESGSPSVVLSEHVPEVVELGRLLLKASGFEGFSCMEFKRDARDGGYKLIEVNGRHNLSGLLALRCGVNFPRLQYRHLMFGELPDETPDYSARRYWVDITRDVRDAAHYLRRPDYSLRRFLEPYVSPHVFAVLSLRDPRPAVGRLIDTVRTLTSRNGSMPPDGPGQDEGVRVAMRGGDPG